MQDAAGRCWRVVGDAGIQTHEWDGQLVLYHGGTGNTHLLDGDAAVIIRVLHKGAATARQLADELNGDAGGEDARQARLARTLDALQRLDIVEPLGETERAARD